MNTFEVIWKTTSETNLQSTKMESHQLNSLERFAASRPVVSNPTSEVVLVDELEAKGPDAEPTSGLLDATESTSLTTVDEAAERETASTEDTTDNVSTPTGASELLCAADSMEVELPEDYDLAADESLQILGETVSPTTSSEDADAEDANTKVSTELAEDGADSVIAATQKTDDNIESPANTDGSGLDEETGWFVPTYEAPTVSEVFEKPEIEPESSEDQGTAATIAQADEPEQQFEATPPQASEPAELSQAEEPSSVDSDAEDRYVRQPDPLLNESQSTDEAYWLSTTATVAKETDFAATSTETESASDDSTASSLTDEDSAKLNSQSELAAETEPSVMHANSDASNKTARSSQATHSSGSVYSYAQDTADHLLASPAIRNARTLLFVASGPLGSFRPAIEQITLELTHRTKKTASMTSVTSKKHRSEVWARRRKGEESSSSDEWQQLGEGLRIKQNSQLSILDLVIDDDWIADPAGEIDEALDQQLREGRLSIWLTQTQDQELIDYLTARCDATMMLVDLNESRVNECRLAVTHLREHGARLLGTIVVNDLKGASQWAQS